MKTILWFSSTQINSRFARLTRNRGLITLSAILAFAGCSESVGTSNASKLAPPTAIDTRSPINKVAFTSSVLTTEARIPVYSKVAQRAGLVDPLSATEIWGSQAAGFDFGIALHDLSGITLFQASRILIAAPTALREFALSSRYYHVAAAASKTSYAVAIAGAARIEIIHALGSGTWQQSLFDLPWIGESVSSDNELQLFFDENATRLVAFSMITGRYAVLRAGPGNQEFTATTSFCEGTTKPADASYLFTAATWVESLGGVLAVDRNGTAHLFAVDEPCTDYVSRPSLVVEADGAKRITSLIPINSASTLALEQGGDVMKIGYSGATMASVDTMLTGVCANPMGALPLPENKLVMVCSRANTAPSAVSQLLHTDSVELSYLTYDLETKLPLSSFSLLQEETAGSGIFAKELKLYRATESSLGELEVYSLVTGEKTLTSGMYTRGLLNRL